MARHKTLLDELHDEIRQDPARQARFERELTRLRLANQIMMLREERGLSQAELAARIGTKQSAVARMERDDYKSCRVSTLVKIATAVGRQLDIRFVQNGRRRAHA